MNLLPDGSLVTVSGISGIHAVVASGQVLDPPHGSYQIRLAPGTRYGLHQAGDLIAVESWRCTPAPADLEDFK